MHAQLPRLFVTLGPAAWLIVPYRQHNTRSQGASRPRSRGQSQQRLQGVGRVGGEGDQRRWGPEGESAFQSGRCHVPLHADIPCIVGTVRSDLVDQTAWRADSVGACGSGGDD